MDSRTPQRGAWFKALVARCGRPERLEDQDQRGQEAQGGDEGHHHRECRQQAEDDARDEVGDRQDRKADRDGDRGVVHRVTDAAVTALHTRDVIAIQLKLALEAVQVDRKSVV